MRPLFSLEQYAFPHEFDSNHKREVVARAHRRTTPGRMAFRRIVSSLFGTIVAKFIVGVLYNCCSGALCSHSCLAFGYNECRVCVYR